MLSHLADALVPAFGRLTVTADADAELAPGSIVVANHTSLADPAVVLAALHRLGARPVVMATAGLWRVPVLGGALAREGHIPVHRGGPRAADALDGAAEALGARTAGPDLRRGRPPAPYGRRRGGARGLPQRPVPARAAHRGPGGARRPGRRPPGHLGPHGQAARGAGHGAAAPPGTARARGRARRAHAGRRPADRTGPHRGDGRLADGGRAGSGSPPRSPPEERGAPAAPTYRNRQGMDRSNRPAGSDTERDGRLPADRPRTWAGGDAPVPMPPRGAVHDHGEGPVHHHHGPEAGAARGAGRPVARTRGSRADRPPRRGGRHRGR